MRALLVATLAISIGSLASAHPHAYVLGNDVVSFTETEDTDGLPDVGGVRFAVGEPGSDGSGATWFGITDAIIAPAGGFYCQDLNVDSICGDDGSIAGVVEPAALFCGAIEVGGFGGTPWEPASEVLIFLDGPLFGSPAFSTCGLTYSAGTAGEVHHAP